MSSVHGTIRAYSQAPGVRHLSNRPYVSGASVYLSFGLGSALVKAGLTDGHWHAGCMALSNHLTTVAGELGVQESPLAACSQSGDNLVSRTLNIQVFEGIAGIRFKNELLDMSRRLPVELDGGVSLMVDIKEKFRVKEDFTHKIVLSQVPHEFCFQGITRLLLQGFGYSASSVLSEELAQVKGVDSRVVVKSGTVVAYVRVSSGDPDLSNLRKRHNLGGLTMNISVEAVSTFTHPVPPPPIAATPTRQPTATAGVSPAPAPTPAPTPAPAPAPAPAPTPAPAPAPPTRAAPTTAPRGHHGPQPSPLGPSHQPQQQPLLSSPRVRARSESDSSDGGSRRRRSTRQRATRSSVIPQSDVTPSNANNVDMDQTEDEDGYGASTSGRETDCPGITVARSEFSRRLRQVSITWFAEAHIRLSSPAPNRRDQKQASVRPRFPQWNLTHVLLDAVQEYGTSDMLAMSQHDRTEFMNLFWESFRQPFNLDALKDEVSVANIPVVVLSEIADCCQDVQRLYDAMYSNPCAAAKRPTRSTCHHPPSATLPGQRAAGC